MYRSIFILALFFIAASEACRPPPCHWHDAKPVEDYYQTVVNSMMTADRKIKRNCHQSSVTVKEQHATNKYVLVYQIQDGNDFEVKVKNRALLVRAGNCEGTLADVRVLPPYVEPIGAYYTVDNGCLTIVFQYKFDPESGGGLCVLPNKTAIILPQKYIKPEFEYTEVEKSNYVE